MCSTSASNETEFIEEQWQDFANRVENRETTFTEVFK